MKSAWNFKYTQADLATVTSNFLLFSEGKLVFKTGVVLDKNSVGLQAENFGWVKALDPEAVVKSVEKFQIVKLPPIIL